MSSKRSVMLSDTGYEKLIHKMGRLTLMGGFLASVLPPVLLWLVYGVYPPFKNLLNGFIGITAVMLPVSIVEVLTFAPILGAGAIYMSYLTGNISNIKIPSAAIALEVTDVKPSTSEGDIIANLAIAGSALAGEIILILGVILILPLSSNLNSPILKPAFEQILPALFGAIGAYYILKNWQLAIAPVSMAIIFGYLIPDLNSAVTIPICVAFSILAARLLYKKEWLKTDAGAVTDDL
ncbi:MAG: hypothetical protein GXY86_00095 [Firmicutes bacterium]|nr:hypothetical protein [Bacillota bacterium]